MRSHHHYWLYTGIPSLLVFLNGRYRYDCSVCDKQIWCKEQPVNPVVPSAWDVYRSEVARGNAHMVIAPPALLIEDQYTEGERYRGLLTKDVA